MSDIIFAHKHIDGRYLIEMKITRINKDKDYPEGIIYSLVAIDRNNGKRVLGFDNHERRAHHMHKFGKEVSYTFIDEWKLIGDFTTEYEKIKKRMEP